MADSDGARLRVFVSHTSELREFPRGGSYIAAVERAVSACGHVIVDMADFPAGDLPPAQLCAERVRSCDVYVGVLGTRYGSPVRGQSGLSYTELEFGVATESGLERLVFLLDDDAEGSGIPLSKLIDLEFGSRQQAFRRRVRESGLVTQSFGDPAVLGQRVERSLRDRARHLSAATGAGREPESPLSSPVARLAGEYLDRVQQRFRRMDLEVLTPLTETDKHPEMFLGQVFVPQMVRADPPPVELPRELWRRLAEGGEISDQALPEDVDKDLIARAQQAYRDRPALPVLDAVAGTGGQKLVLLGDPGAGKSTLARYLMLALADAYGHGTGPPDSGVPAPARLAGTLPLLVELRAYADPRWQDRTFLDLVGHLHATEGLGLPAAALEGFLRHGGAVLVVFDGLDEVFDPKRREEITRQVEAFASRYPQARVIVTSRPVGYRRAILDGAGFTHYMLQDLDLGQVKEFTTAWYQASWPGNPAEAARLNERLLGAVEHSAAVAELAGNPMLLTILAIIGRRRQLPRDRRSVYEHAVSVLVEHWDATGKLLTGSQADAMPYLEYRDKLELLHQVARHMQDGPAGLAGNHIPDQDLRTQFEAYLRSQFELPPERSIPAAKAMLRQLRERNFILARFGGGAYGFVHRVFLEYLAAHDICQRFSARLMTEDELLGVFRRHWNDPAWREVLLLVTGMIPENFAAKVIDTLLAADPAWRLRPDPAPQHLLLALGCLGEVRRLGGLSSQSRNIAIAIASLIQEQEFASSFRRIEVFSARVNPAFTT